MATGEDPLVGINFFLELDGTTIASFRECSGLEVEVEVIESKETDMTGKMVIRKIPGANKYLPDRLEEGPDQRQVPVGQVRRERCLRRASSASGRYAFKRYSGSVVIKDVTGQAEVARYTFDQCWISKYKGGELNATSNNLAVEEVTIVHEGLHRKK